MFGLVFLHLFLRFRRRPCYFLQSLREKQAVEAIPLNLKKLALPFWRLFFKLPCCQAKPFCYTIQYKRFLLDVL